MKWTAWLTVGALALIVPTLNSTTGRADDGNPAYTSADEAPVDFRFQGEYLGSPVEDPNFKIGVQVIALGEGKFDLVAYHGGLPGAGWSRGDETIKATGELDGDKAVFTSDEGRAEIKNGEMKVWDNDGNHIATLNKVKRESPTLGERPADGAVVLFDGSSADEFENGRLVEEKYLGATNVTSKLKLTDHHLHIEFRTPFMPKSRGQGRGNSGVYVQGRFEVQVLDSFGLDGKNNECGGIYSVGEPAVNMCLPPLSWQTYDIDFTAARYDDAGNKTANARITVRHNGVLIHDNVELPNGTPGGKPDGVGPEGLFLQDHGNPVVFRNIWVVEK
ncbi:MAG: DUF1080 domain-containing protein [Pirellulaceae bacterium]|nr:DUF1080 domain-containing protein [Planctomycetales bacterium]